MRLKKILLFGLLLLLVGCIPDEKKVAKTERPPQNRSPVVQEKPIPTTSQVQAKVAPSKDIKDLKTALATGLPVVLKMGSDSCYPCKLMKPILKELAEEQDGKIVFLDLEIKENQDLAHEYEVRLIPAIIFFDKRGQAKAKHEGFLDKRQLLEWVDYLELER